MHFHLRASLTRLRGVVAIGVNLATWSTVTAARAQTSSVMVPHSVDQRCMQSSLVVAEQVDENWRQLLTTSCEELAGMRSSDPAATIHVSQQDQVLTLSAQASDGRTTERTATTSDELRLTLEALLFLPPQVERPIMPSNSADRTKRPKLTPPPNEVSGFGIESGLGAEGRVAATPVYVFAGLNGYVAARFEDLIVGLGLRLDFLEFVAHERLSPLEYSLFGVEFGLASREDLGGGSSLDWGGQLLLTSESQTVTSSTPDPDTTGDFKVGGMIRLNLPTDMSHWYIALDTDISPSRLRRKSRIDAELPQLPAWTLGLGVGWTWALY